MVRDARANAVIRDPWTEVSARGPSAGSLGHLMALLGYR